MESSSPCLSTDITGMCIILKLLQNLAILAKNMHIERLCTPHTGQYCYDYEGRRFKRKQLIRFWKWSVSGYATDPDTRFSLLCL